MSIDDDLIVSTIHARLAAKEAGLQNLDTAFSKIKTIVHLSDSDSILSISNAVKILKKNVASLRKALNDQTELQIELDKILHANEFIDGNKAKHARLENAINILDRMSKDRGKTAMEAFFKENRELISDIYVTIHSPKEFNAITFSDGKILLVKPDGSEHPVNRISTGQRSALAMSLFIALNRQLKDGPKIMLFDDPVAFTDDFNILSLLDFLRFFILKEGKQIFFATANARLASLIEKKFEFMGNHFKQFHLER
ncbi:hypothetical protein MKQ70_32680 [Chitinophaga sedimenti]|uniref:hypothetical protein n=1 Tax=Chitinophaga sedimenti TaxID=2033606 RepID=UPI002004BACC|nr:hypothetical protein [Chitinophaga sedimenti]MCK7559472.1 hypothetical protein [Chitinophaga sedimenti]